MGRRDQGDDEGLAVFLIILLIGLLAGLWNYRSAELKCKKAGKSPAFCDDFLR